MMNTMNAPSKRSTLEKKLDKLIITIFCALFMMCLIGAIGWYDNLLTSNFLQLFIFFISILLLILGAYLSHMMMCFTLWNDAVQLWQIASTTIWAFMRRIGSTLTDLWYRMLVIRRLMCYVLLLFCPLLSKTWFLSLVLQIAFFTFFTLLTLFSTIIPISLYVSIEVNIFCIINFV